MTSSTQPARLPTYAEAVADLSNCPAATPDTPSPDPSRLPAYRPRSRNRFHPYTFSLSDAATVDEYERFKNTIYDDEMEPLSVPPIVLLPRVRHSTSAHRGSHNDTHSIPASSPRLRADESTGPPTYQDDNADFEARRRRSMETAQRLQRLSAVMPVFVRAVIGPAHVEPLNNQKHRQHA